jgi:DNA-binding FadR family transcriptional regulator
MPVQAVETRRLYRQIADQIEGLIASGEFLFGARLPPERDLAQKLGVSRATVREAMIALELSGKVDIRIGAGIFVRESSPPRRSRAPARRNGEDPGPGAFELVDARIAIESGIAALAASNRTEAELDTIGAALRTMERALDEGASSDDGDRAFHIAVAESTHNATLVRTVIELWSWRKKPMWRRLRPERLDERLGRRWLADHERVFVAIRRRDSGGAYAAMRDHLVGVKEELLEVLKAIDG